MNLSNYKFLLNTDYQYLLDYRILLYNLIKLILQQKIKKRGEIVCLNKNGNVNLLNFMNKKVLLTKINKFSDVFKLNLNIKNKLKIYPTITVKVIPLTYKDRENMYNSKFAVWKELKVLKLLTNLSKKRMSPNLPIIYDYYICNSCKYENPNIKNTTDRICLLVLSEYNNYDLRTWLINLSKKKLSANKLSDIWYNCLFQIISALYLIYKQYKLVHLDLHWGNILVQTHQSDGYTIHRIEGINYYLPNLGFTIKLWDFGKSKSKHLFKEDTSVNIYQLLDINRLSNIYNWINKYPKITNKSVIPTNIINLFKSIQNEKKISLNGILYRYMSRYMHNMIGNTIVEQHKKYYEKVDYAENFHRGEIVLYKNKYAVIQDIYKFKIYLIQNISDQSQLIGVNFNEVYKILTNVSQKTTDQYKFLKKNNNGIYII